MSSAAIRPGPAPLEATLKLLAGDLTWRDPALAAARERERR